MNRIALCYVNFVKSASYDLCIEKSAVPNCHLFVGIRIPTETSGTTLPLDLKVQIAAGLDASQVTTKLL